MKDFSDRLDVRLSDSRSVNTLSLYYIIMVRPWFVDNRNTLVLLDYERIQKKPGIIIMSHFQC